MRAWWHRRRGHTVTMRRCTPLMFDMSRGELYRCSCGKVWTR